MQCSNGRVSIPTTTGPMLCKDFGEASGVFGEIFQIDRAVFDDGDWFCITAHRHHDIQTLFSDFPDLFLERGLLGSNHRIGLSEVRHHLFQLVESSNIFELIFFRELNQQ